MQIVTDVPVTKRGRPVGNFSSLGAAIRRLNVGEAVEIAMPSKEERNRISSLVYETGKADKLKFITRANRYLNLFHIQRTA